MSRLPWFKLFKTDWLQEPTFRLCSRAARSLWLDMLCLMHDAQPCGHLKLKGKRLDAKSLAAVFGDREKDVVAWLAELESNGVFSRGRGGVIVSRRMVRDAAKAELGLESAQRRWGKGDAAPNGLANGKPIERAKGQARGKPIAQTPDSRVQIQESDSDSDSNQKNRREDAGVPSEPSGATAAAPAERKALKRPELADQHLAEHLSRHGGMDAGAAWLLIATARDPAAPDHDIAARRCEDYSQRHRLGWFAAERASAFPPALKPRAISSKSGLAPIAVRVRRA